MIVFAVVTALLGYGIGHALGSSRAVTLAAFSGLAVASLGTYLWGMPPFRYLAGTLGYLYGALMFGVFFLSAGILLRSLLARAWRTAP